MKRGRKNDLALSSVLLSLKENSISRTNFILKNSLKQTTSFFSNHSTLSYCLKRISISLACLAIGLTLIFILVRWNLEKTGIEAFMPDSLEKNNWTEEQKHSYYNKLLQLNNLDGNLWNQILHFWYNIIPFFPKHILTSNSVVNFETGQLEPIYETRFIYFGVTMTNVLGSQNLDVSSEFETAMPYSFTYGLITITISYLLGVPLGILAAIKNKKISGKLMNSVSLFIYSLPSVIIIMFFFLLPVGFFSQSSLFFSESFWPKFWPALTMCFLFVPFNIIMTRKYFVEEIQKDYVLFAYSKGLTTNMVFFKHIFRNTCVVILRSLPLDLGMAIFGFSIITETQWNIPGLGKMLTTCLTPASNEPMVIMMYITISSVLITFTSLLADLIMIWLDPRVKIQGGKK